MLTSIKVGNFKAFAETQNIPIRPITLIYGANSSGKSSILHSLILANQITETNELDVHFTKTGGDAVDLGGFKQFIHRRDTSRSVNLEWEISEDESSKRLNELLPKVKKTTIGVSIGLSGRSILSDSKLKDLTPREVIQWLINDAKEKNDQAEVDRLESIKDYQEDKLTIEDVSRLRSKPQVEKCWLNLDDRLFLSLSVRDEGYLQLDLFDRKHNAAKFLIKNLILAHSTTDHVDQREINALANTIDELVPKLAFKIVNLFPSGLISSDEQKSTSKALSRIFIPVTREKRLEDLAEVIKGNLPGILEEILIGISELIKREIAKLTYLGPLRTYPPRHMGLTESSDPNWIAGGGASWDAVRKDSHLRERVNDWLGNEKKLSSSYQIIIRNLLTIESIKSKLATLISDIDGKYYEGFNKDEGEFTREIEDVVAEASDEIPDTLEKLAPMFSDIQELVLYDKRSKTIVSHRDVGIGISQVLPVLATCFASREKIVAMEQPEIHLHPALQAELGDVFIESALGDSRNTLLIETHSEHLILRILRRIRETRDKELPQGLLPIRPEDVSVIYVQPTDKGSEIVYIPINEDAEFERPWPQGFFAERTQELF